MEVYAYIRVSTQMQTLDNQEFEIIKWAKRNNVSIDRWVRESVSGTVGWEKRSLGSLLRRMKRGDLLICSEISRLGRKMLMVMSILNYCSNKGIRIITIKDNFNLSDDINSKIIAFAFALASEIERNLISQRTKEALAVKKLSGIKLGRPSRMTPKVRKLSDEIELVRARIETGETKSSIAREYGVHRNTLDKCLRSGNDVIFLKN
ncbi:MAG: recombinase family protein [Bacteroidales bacterium]|nr:recombinase family protein [Bacteroidales bacterium]